MGRSASKNKTVKRVGSVHRRAKSVGVFYFIGTLLLTVLSCVTFLTAPHFGKEIGFSTGIFNISTGSVSQFWAPLMAGGISVYFIAAVLYIILLLTMVINLIRCFPIMKTLFKKNSKKSRPANPMVELARINKKKTSMEALGKVFSGSFATMICINFLIYLIVPFVKIEIFAVIAVGVGVFFHMLCGVLGAKVTGFYSDNRCCCGHHHYMPMPMNYPIYDPRMLSQDADMYGQPQVVGTLKQEKREYSIWIFFFRNLFQLLSVFGLIIAINNVTTLHIDLAHILNDADIIASFSADVVEGYAVNYIMVAVEALMLLCLFMLIKHATSTTEFNFQGMDGVGMKRFRVFSVLTLLMGTVFMVLQMIGGAAMDVWIPIALIVVVAFLGMVVDCIIHPKDRDEGKILFYSDEMEDEEYMKARYRV